MAKVREVWHSRVGDKMRQTEAVLRRKIKGTMANFKEQFEEEEHRVRRFRSRRMAVPPGAAKLGTKKKAKLLLQRMLGLQLFKPLSLDALGDFPKARTRHSRLSIPTPFVEKERIPAPRHKKVAQRQNRSGCNFMHHCRVAFKVP